MHAKYIDLARHGVAWRDAQPDDAARDRKVSAAVWLMPLVVFWVIVACAVM